MARYAMQKKSKAARHFLAALALIALIFNLLNGNGISASAASDEPDFLVLYPERE